MPGLKRRVPARPEEVGTLRHLVVAYAADAYPNAAAEFGDGIALAVTEACTNVVRHAYPDGGGEMTLTAWMDDPHLYVRIEDHGIGLDAPAGNPGLGLGLPLIAAHATLDITSAGGTQLLMRFPRELPTT